MAFFASVTDFRQNQDNIQARGDKSLDTFFKIILLYDEIDEYLDLFGLTERKLHSSHYFFTTPQIRLDCAKHSHFIF